MSIATQAERSPTDRGRNDAAIGQPLPPGPPLPVPLLPTPPLGSPSLTAPTFSVVAPAYNEAENLPEFHAQISAVMDGLGEPWELVLINDGSRDTTLLVMEALRAADPRIAIVNLSRNFGKEIATTAGLDHARGAAIILIDTDLQDPPEVIPQLVAGWRAGYDTVYAQRRQRQGESWLKRATAAAFYRILRRATPVPVPADTGDFRLMSRRVVTALLQLREHHRFMKGLFAWVGFPSCAVLYDRHPRHAGVSAWNYWKLWNFALEGITSFTTAPLRMATYLGLLVGFGAAVFLAQLMIRTMLFGNEVPGYPSLMAVVLFLGGAQLITLGSIGEYLGRVFNEVKHRPLYFVEQYKPSVGGLADEGYAMGGVQAPDRVTKVG
jgi:glycosyltransferase involved in cell wall biosynthesis